MKSTKSLPQTATPSLKQSRAALAKGKGGTGEQPAILAAKPKRPFRIVTANYKGGVGKSLLATVLRLALTRVRPELKIAVVDQDTLNSSTMTGQFLTALGEQYYPVEEADVVIVDTPGQLAAEGLQKYPDGDIYIILANLQRDFFRGAIATIGFLRAQFPQKDNALFWLYTDVRPWIKSDVVEMTRYHSAIKESGAKLLKSVLPSRMIFKFLNVLGWKPLTLSENASAKNDVLTLAKEILTLKDGGNSDAEKTFI